MRKDGTLIEIGIAGNRFVICNSEWVALSRDDREISLSSAPVAFYVFLELRIDETRDLLEQACQKAGIYKEDCPCIRIEEVIKSALSSNSAEWQALALMRVDEVDANEGFIDLLTRLTRSGRTQRIRHDALKLRAKILRFCQGTT